MNESAEANKITLAQYYLLACWAISLSAFLGFIVSGIFSLSPHIVNFNASLTFSLFTLGCSIYFFAGNFYTRFLTSLKQVITFLDLPTDTELTEATKSDIESAKTAMACSNVLMVVAPGIILMFLNYQILSFILGQIYYVIQICILWLMIIGIIKFRSSNIAKKIISQ